jgi:hypothetical protein
MTNNGLRYTLGDFLTNSSGQLGYDFGFLFLEFPNMKAMGWAMKGVFLC